MLVNDFGTAGIDGEIFSSGGIESVELPSGCVCCTLKFDLIATIQKIMKEFSPEHLVIEPSGIASPRGVLEALESAGILAYSVVGIVDAAEFAELYESGMYGSFFREQIALSDVMLVNKMDLVDESRMAEAEKLVGSINPRAILYRTKNGELQDCLVLPPAGERVGAKNGVSGGFLFENSRHLHFETLSFKLSCNTRLAGFSTFFHILVRGRYGTVARAKALVDTDEGPYRFDGVFGRVDSTRFGQTIEDSRLVVIGERLDKQAIEKGLLENR